MRNHTKPRVGTKGGLGCGLQEPNLSGAYIRSLVKQLASSRKHVNPGGLYPTSKTPVKEASKMHTCAQGPMQIDQGSDKIMKLSSNLDEQAKAAINPVVLQQKKQVRRRPHTRKQSQECLLNIAEARREIVAALHLHRAANGSATKPPPNPIIKPARVNTRNSPSSKHSTSAKQSAGNNSTRCNSCMSKAVSSTATHRACNEAKAITICGHLLCWMCLSQYLQNFSAFSIFKGCPVCAKPLNMGNDIFPITLGVPIRQASDESAYATPVLQSAPLLINQLPAAQPAWSTTGPSLLPMSSGMNIAQNPSLYQHENIADPTLNPTALTATSCSGTPERANLGLPNIEQDLPKNWHVAVDDEELTQIRSLGEQHDMEWNDTVNLATTTRWFKFLKASELPDSLYEWENERNDNISLQKQWEAPLAKFECKDDVGFDVQLLTEEPLISDFMDRSTIKECLHILPELPLESLWLDDCFDYHDCIQGLKNPQNYNENHPLACSEMLKCKPASEDFSSDDTAIYSELGSENPDSAGVSSTRFGSKRARNLQL